MVERFKLIVNELRQNLDLYVTILLAIVFGTLGVLGATEIKIISAGVLTTLGLLAYSLLSNRKSSEALTERLNLLENISFEIKEIIRKKTPLDEFFLSRAQLPPLEKQIEDAESIDICGMSLLAISTRHRKMLLSKVEKGCKIRLLLLNPNNESLMQMVSPFIGSLTIAAHTRAIFTSLDCLTSDSDFFNSERVEIRLYNYPLAHGMLIINRDTRRGKLRVETYMSGNMPADAPGLYIHKNEEPAWFEFYCKEFEEIWANASPYSESSDL